MILYSWLRNFWRPTWKSQRFDYLYEHSFHYRQKSMAYAYKEHDFTGAIMLPSPFRSPCQSITERVRTSRSSSCQSTPPSSTVVNYVKTAIRTASGMSFVSGLILVLRRYSVRMAKLHELDFSHPRGESTTCDVRTYIQVSCFEIQYSGTPIKATCVDTKSLVSLIASRPDAYCIWVTFRPVGILFTPLRV